MATAAFDGVEIFGEQIRMLGPFGGRERTVDSRLPGVNGARSYRLGRDIMTWTIRGRLTKFTERSISDAIMAGIRYMDGQVYTFTDNWGGRFDNCRLADFRQIGGFQAIRSGGNARGFTVEIQATVEWMSPDFARRGLATLG